MKSPFVLVIDDDAEVANTARFLLQRAGFEVASAYSAEEGWERAVEMQPDAIILDVALPRINGLKILQRLKANVATAHIPVILMSGYHPFDCSGAYTFLLKPFTATNLVSAARNAIANEPEPFLPLAA